MESVWLEAKQPKSEVERQLMEALSCQICLEILTPPVYFCKQGHSFCLQCCIKFKNYTQDSESTNHKECPNCKGPIKPNYKN